MPRILRINKNQNFYEFSLNIIAENSKENNFDMHIDDNGIVILLYPNFILF